MIFLSHFNAEKYNYVIKDPKCNASQPAASDTKLYMALSFIMIINHAQLLTKLQFVFKALNNLNIVLTLK